MDFLLIGGFIAVVALIVIKRRNPELFKSLVSKLPFMK
jgi:hypothetical protein